MNDTYVSIGLGADDEVKVRRADSNDSVYLQLGTAIVVMTAGQAAALTAALTASTDAPCD